MIRDACFAPQCWLYAARSVITWAPAAPFAGQSPAPTGWVLLTTEVRAGIVGARLCRANQRAALAGLVDDKSISGVVSHVRGDLRSSRLSFLHLCPATCRAPGKLQGD